MSQVIYSEVKITARSLSQYLHGVKNLLEKNIADEWIEAEISSISKPRTGHCHIDLVEINNLNKEIAKVRANIWKIQLPLIVDKFVKTTGSELVVGLKIKVKVKASFSEIYAFSVIILDIDPTYTLGNIEANKIAILKKLEEQGLANKNKQFASPFHFFKVAVVSSNDAAGLSDFKKEADLLMRLNLCDFDYYDVAVQGVNTSESVTNGLRNIFIKQRDGAGYDVVVILRGGGSISDLNWFNDYKIAYAVVQMNLPVYIGIGHKKDHCVLDAIANQSFDTPSKVILHIENKILQNLRLLERNYQNILRDAVRQIKSIRQCAVINCHLIMNEAREFFNKKQSLTFNSVSIAVNKLENILFNQGNKANQQIITVIDISKSQLNQINFNCRTEIMHILVNAKFIYRQTSSQLSNLLLQVIENGLKLIELSLIQIDNLIKKIMNNANFILANSRGVVIRYGETINNISEAVLNNYKLKSKHLMELVLANSIEPQLKRGFTITRQLDNKIMYSANDARKSRKFMVQFHDGSVKVKVM